MYHDVATKAHVPTHRRAHTRTYLYMRQAHSKPIHHCNDQQQSQRHQQEYNGGHHQSILIFWHVVKMSLNPMERATDRCVEGGEDRDGGRARGAVDVLSIERIVAAVTVGWWVWGGWGVSVDIFVRMVVVDVVVFPSLSSYLGCALPRATLRKNSRQSPR